MRRIIAADFAVTATAVIWFFNAQMTPSLGASGAFSSNGTFKGPAVACPPGGTY